MFSPDATSHGHSLRPKRTRQAAGSDDSLKPPQAKRKRSALRKDTFEPVTQASLNEVAGRQKEVNGHAITSEKAPSISNASAKELAFRGGKKTEKRPDRTTGTFTLSTNELYTVAQLPALPDQIRNRPDLLYSCTVSTDHGYAIALTHTEALVWSYNSSSTSPSSRDLLSFKLPFPPASAADPLPLAAFTARSAAGEPGLLAVSLRWGKIVYWETFANASSFVPGQISHGVQASIPSLANGEFVREIVNAEPAGFIMCSNHGRAFHVTVRDQMGRPGIGVQTLRRPTIRTLGGLIGSIRHALGGDRRTGTPMVRAGKASKGQRDLVIASEDGELEFWNVKIGVGDSLDNSVSTKETLMEALQAAVPEDILPSSTFKLLDLELTSRPHTTRDLVKHGDKLSTQFTTLVQISHLDQTHYYLIEAQVKDVITIVQVVHPIRCYSTPISDSTTWRPKIAVSEPTNLAFIAFEDSIVIFSLARPQDSPSSQLFLDRPAPREPFQDCIKFQNDMAFRVIAFVNEEPENSDKRATLILAISSFGLVRLTANSMTRASDEEDDEFDYRITAKSKIEQAVFFGSLTSNPLDLTTSIQGQSFSATELSTAALEISCEILTSSSKYLPKSTPSIEAQLKLRGKALEDLAQYLMSHHASTLDRSTRFNLLWNAEKLSAAQAIWRTQQSIEKRYVTLKDREMPYMHFVLRALHESRQTYPDAEKGESDRVRHWLVNDPDKMGHFLSELISCTKELEAMDINDPQVVAEYFKEAQDIWIAAYETAFKFREDRCHDYGLGDEVFTDGILQGGYPDDTQQLWTTAPEPLKYGELFIPQICRFVRDWWESPLPTGKASKKQLPVDENGKAYAAPSRQILSYLVNQLQSQAEIVVKLLDESFNDKETRLNHGNTDASSKAEQLASLDNERISKRRETVNRISEFNKQGAIRIAENMADTPLLVDMNLKYIQELSIRRQLAATSNPAETQRMDQELRTIQDHAETYYGKFGTDWALAHFSRNMQDGDLGDILQEAQANDGEKQHYLTWFLQESQKLGVSVDKLSWINDIIGENQYGRALNTLSSMSLKRKDDLWGKKTETCLAKLASFAASEDAEANGAPQPSQAPRTVIYDQELDIMAIQMALLEHVLSLTLNAIDAQAAQELVMKEVSVRVVKDKPALKNLLGQGLDDLVAGRALTAYQLVDVLTLMDPVQFQGIDEQEDPGIQGYEFSLALQVVDASTQLNQVEKQALQKSIWRRAMIRDDWLRLNETSLKDDESVERAMEMSALFATLVQVMDRQNRHPKDSLRLWSPQEILDAELFPPSLQERFESQELDEIEMDLRSEQDRLQAFVAKGRLELHFGGLVQSAEDGVRSATGEVRIEAGLVNDQGRQAEPIDLDDMQVSQTNGFH